ncbi:glycine betaine ABC transporter substrate-binding protein [Bacillus rubiinfantis]|uniref:glycine betaine ABC transporter substrate-binding protein n=1 Tax=Bacillus rubiinfantis TaxID=1499680 RepID=UPI001651FBD8|nr:glycine betaine ABC transporter substrate-binding protein [Bacillus rubiinfantis]
MRRNKHYKYNIACLKPFGFENIYALVLNSEKYKQLGVKTISDFAPLSSQINFGGPTEFYEREDGYDPLVETYGLNFNEHRSLDPSLMYAAVKEEESRCNSCLHNR